MTEAAVALAVLIAAALGYHFFVAPSYSLLRNRSPEKERWSQLYTQSEMPIVIRALQTVCDAFLLRDADIYRLLPSDRLFAIYRAAYPLGGADAMEFEELYVALSESFGVPEQALNDLDDPTVSDIIRLCLSHATNVA